ncbi:ABC transporter ATP-binding protein [Ruminococcus sp. OA3]|uniref:ABC transporter ATP-binding protein n=1 Tax=Ruminococcus sp. OA3 TaxID=2914164 RepID=UPI001F05D2A8|nr:ABC transporter ATP-binding protein [Ruminococcus sp. OA3]MCH1983568.1 ABC transporter ATP-binding protein [Ruminococcus sp. OA3]
MSVIEINHITKDYGEGRGVFDVSFGVWRGEVLGFLGPNGAGKTTTIRQLMGFMKPDSGSLTIGGRDCFEKADEIQKYLGYLPGEIAFIDSMNGMEFIRFIAHMKKMKDLGRAPELMDMFDLNPSGKLKKMSKGMKQKIGIVCAFMQDPKLLILDEPTSGLDPLMQNKFVDLILREKKRGKTILMSSHSFEEVEKTCDRAAIIRGGKLAAVEKMEKLRTGRKKIVQMELETAAMAADMAAQFSGAELQNRTVTVKVGKDVDLLIKKASQYKVLDMDIRTQSLEEFFMHFYGGEEDA